MSFFFMVTFFGIKIINMMIDNNSLIMLYRIKPVIVALIPYFKRCGVITIVIMSLVICSKRFEVT